MGLAAISFKEQVEGFKRPEQRAGNSHRLHHKELPVIQYLTLLQFLYPLGRPFNAFTAINYNNRLLQTA